MSKLIIALGAFAAGGAERVLSVLSTPFADKFDEVIYLMWRTNTEFYPIDPRVRKVYVERESGYTRNIKKIAWVRKFIKREDPTIVLSFLTKFNLLTLVSLLGTKYKIAVAVRNDPAKEKGGKLIRVASNILYRRACGILCQTDSIRKYYKEPLLSKTHIIYNPISFSREYKGKALTTPKTNRIVTVGRLMPFKNHALMIDGFKLFLDKHPDYKLEIIGEGPLRQSLEDKINELKLKDAVLLPGKKDNIKDYILDACAFILTSDHEGMSNAMIEAMSLGLPVISTHVSGAVDFIHTGENGILIERTPEAVSKALCNVVENVDFATSLGKNASEFYETISPERIFGEWIEYLKDKINERN